MRARLYVFMWVSDAYVENLPLFFVFCVRCSCLLILMLQLRVNLKLILSIARSINVIDAAVAAAVHVVEVVNVVSVLDGVIVMVVVALLAAPVGVDAAAAMDVNIEVGVDDPGTIVLLFALSLLSGCLLLIC